MRIDLKYKQRIIKKQITLLNVLINRISAGLEPEIFSIKGEFSFLFFNFPIIGLCNSSANSLFAIFSFVIPLLRNLFFVANVSDHVRVAEVFYQKIYKPLKQLHLHIHKMLAFQQHEMPYYAIYFQRLSFYSNL